MLFEVEIFMGKKYIVFKGYIVVIFFVFLYCLDNVYSDSNEYKFERFRESNFEDKV